MVNNKVKVTQKVHKYIKIKINNNAFHPQAFKRK